MPPITVHVTDAEYDELSARAADAGLALRSYVRRELTAGAQSSDVASELADHEERIARLEELVITLGLGA